MEELEALDRKHREKRSELEAARRDRDIQLGQDSLEELEAALRGKKANLEKAKETRDSLLSHALSEEDLKRGKEEREALEKKRQELERKFSENQGVLNAVGDDEDKLQERVRRCARELHVARVALEELDPYKCGPDEFGRLGREVEELGERVKELESRETVLKDRIAQETLGEEDLAASEERLESVRRRTETLRRRYEVNRIIAENLEWSREQSISGFSQEIGERMGEILSAITGGKYGKVEVDGNLGVKVYSEEKGDFLDLEEREATAALSTGTLDQIYLAARLAVLEAVTGDRKPPLILDDTFVSFDDMGRKQNAFELLKRIAEERQVLYFTCHECPPDLQVVELG